MERDEKVSRVKTLKEVIEKLKTEVEGQISAVDGKVDKISVPTKVSQLANDSKYQTEAQVDAKISAVYKPGGSRAFASLPQPTKDVLGMVYNVTDAFTTNTSFVEGSENNYPKGTNVVVVSDGSAYKFDVLSGFVDLSNYVTKDGSKVLSTNDYTTAEKTKLGGIAEKATRVEGSTNGKIKINGTDTTVYTHPSGNGNNHIPIDGASGQFLGYSVAGTAKWTTLPAASKTVAGTMSAADKTKLDGIELATDEDAQSLIAELFPTE